MKRKNTLLFFLCFLFLLIVTWSKPTSGRFFRGPAVVPKNHVVLVNATDKKIVYYASTDNTNWSPQTLEKGASTTYNTLFLHLRIVSGSKEVDIDLLGGARYNIVPVFDGTAYYYSVSALPSIRPR
jgi:hypothetical protein